MKHIKTTIAKLMEAARRSRGYKEEINFFENMPRAHHYLKDVQQYKVHPDFFISRRQLAYHDRANWEHSSPIIKGFAGDLCLSLRKQNIPVYCHTAYRSPETQKVLQTGGMSNLQSGPHQRGAAVDIVHSLYHWRLSRHMWDYIGALGEEIIKRRGYPIEWGGHWTNPYDPAHWQLKDWRKTSIIKPAKVTNFTPTALRAQNSGVTKR